MMQEQDIYLDHRLDKIGALLAKLQRAAAGTAREEARSELCKAAIEDGYEFFVGNFMRYQLNQIGDSYLYQVPDTKRGHLAPFRGKLIRIACWKRGTQFDRHLMAGLINFEKPTI
jgi:hypothetical protein